jgi:hypothetical protein
MHGQGPHHPWADPRLNDPRNPDPNNYIANGAASVLGWDTVQAAANAVQQTFHGQQTWQRDMESQAAYVRMLAEQGLPHQAIQQRHYAEQMEPLRAIRTKAGQRLYFGYYGFVLWGQELTPTGPWDTTEQAKEMAFHFVRTSPDRSDVLYLSVLFPRDWESQPLVHVKECTFCSAPWLDVAAPPSCRRCGRVERSYLRIMSVRVPMMEVSTSDRKYQFTELSNSWLWNPKYR